jgi:glycosyltransferase involved in cell wall biosynthesis
MQRSPSTTSEPRIDVTIISSVHDVADARLHREVRALAAAGLEVEVIGTGDPAGGPTSAHVIASPRVGLMGRAWRALSQPWRARGTVLMSLDPDVAVGIALRVLLSRRRFVADVHEDYRDLLRDRKWAYGPRGWAARAVLGIAAWALRSADLVVKADEHLTAPPASFVLRNLPDRALLPGLTAPGPEPRALYVGDVRRSRGLFAMVEAIAAAPGWSLDIVGPVTEADSAELVALMESDIDLAQRVRMHGRRPPRESWQLASGAWVGLLMLEDTPAFRAAVPSKLYEYLASGLPVLTTDLPRSAQLITETGAGAVVGSSQEATEVLLTWARDPAAYAQVRTAAERAESRFDGSSELEEFARQVAELAL